MTLDELRDLRKANIDPTYFVDGPIPYEFYGAPVVVDGVSDPRAREALDQRSPGSVGLLFLIAVTVVICGFIVSQL